MNNTLLKYNFFQKKHCAKTRFFFGVQIHSFSSSNSYLPIIINSVLYAHVMSELLEKRKAQEVTKINVHLISSDGVSFNVPVDVAGLSSIIIMTRRN